MIFTIYETFATWYCEQSLLVTLKSQWRRGPIYQQLFPGVKNDWSSIGHRRGAPPMLSKNVLVFCVRVVCVCTLTYESEGHHPQPASQPTYLRHTGDWVECTTSTCWPPPPLFRYYCVCVYTLQRETLLSGELNHACCLLRSLTKKIWVTKNNETSLSYF